MKEIHFLFFAFLLLTVVGCGRIDLPEDEEQSGTTPGGSDTETSEWISVAEALAANEGDVVVVRGYIVGYINGTSLNKAVFACPDDAPNTNMLLADKPDETDVAKCMPILLSTKGTPSPRSVLNLYDNPSNLHRLILVAGEIETYFSVNGIRDLREYEWGANVNTSDYPLPVIDPTPTLVIEGR